MPQNKQEIGDITQAPAIYFYHDYSWPGKHIVEHLTHYPNIEASNPAIGAARD